MFGATESLVFPSKVQATFQVLGNAITVPHSVLALSIAFLSITGEAIDPLQLVRQVWASRLTAYNTVVFEQGDFVHFVPRGLHALVDFRQSCCSVPNRTSH